MKKLIAILLLLGCGSAATFATDITVAAALINNFRASNIGTTRTLTVSVTNGSTSVTCSACLPSNLVNQSGYIVTIASTNYYVAATSTTSAFTLASSYSGVTNASASAALHPYVFLRIYSSMDWLPLGALSIVQAGAPGTNNFHLQRAASVIGTDVYLPEMTLAATTDPASNAHKNARYSAWLHRPDGGQIQVYGIFQNFAVPATPTSTTWAALAIYNTPFVQRPPNNNTYTQEQVNALFNAIPGGNVTLSDTSRAVVTNSSGGLTTVTGVTSTEVGHLDGVTSPIQPQIDLKAPLASPALTGTPTTPTASTGTNTTQIASTAFVQNQIAATVPDADIATDGKARLGERAAYAIASLPTCNASRVNVTVNVTDGNRGQRTCRNTDGGNYNWVDDDTVFRPERWGGVADNSTDNTSAVQAAITAIGNAGGTVWVPDGMQFSLSSLTFGKQVVLNYRADDDRDNANYYTGQNSGERINFSANASTGGSGGIVNEQDFSASFNPGIVLNVMKNIAGHDGFLGVGQSRTNPARATFLIRNERNNMFGIQHIQYPIRDALSGTYLTGYRNKITISGITTASFGSVPSVYELITGSTSGAKGYVLSIDGSNLVVLWITGKFTVGETVSDSNETTLDTISAATFNEASFPWVAQSERTGHWSVGLPPGIASHLFAVGGDVALTKTRTAGQYVESTVTHPTIHFLDGYEEVSPSGFALRYDTTNGAGARSLGVRTYGGSYDLWRIVQDGAMRMLHSNGSTMFDVTNNGSGQGLLAVYSAGTRTHQFYAGGDSFNNAGKMGYGFTTTPDARVQIRSTTEQLRLDYDATNYVSNTVSSGGDLTVAPSGGDMSVTGNLAANSGDLQVGTAGKSMQIKTGTNACAGVATLVAGTATVSTTCTGTLGTNRVVILTPVGASTGAVRVSASVNDTSFTITSSDGASTDAIHWVLLKIN